MPPPPKTRRPSSWRKWTLIIAGLGSLAAIAKDVHGSLRLLAKGGKAIVEFVTTYGAPDTSTNDEINRRVKELGATYSHKFDSTTTTYNANMLAMGDTIGTLRQDISERDSQIAAAGRQAVQDGETISALQGESTFWHRQAGREGRRADSLAIQRQKEAHRGDSLSIKHKKESRRGDSLEIELSVARARAELAENKEAGLKKGVAYLNAGHRLRDAILKRKLVVLHDVPKKRRDPMKQEATNQYRLAEAYGAISADERDKFIKQVEDAP